MLPLIARISGAEKAFLTQTIRRKHGDAAIRQVGVGHHQGAIAGGQACQALAFNRSRTAPVLNVDRAATVGPIGISNPMRAREPRLVRDPLGDCVRTWVCVVHLGGVDGLFG